MDGTTTSVFELPEHAPDAAGDAWPEARPCETRCETVGVATSPEKVASEIQRLLTVARDALAEAESAEDAPRESEGLSSFQWPAWNASATNCAASTAAPSNLVEAEMPPRKTPVRLVVARMTLDARRCAAFRERESTAVDSDVDEAEAVEIWVGDRLHARGRLAALDGCYAVRVTQVMVAPAGEVAVGEDGERIA